MTSIDLAGALRPTVFIDSDTETIRAFAAAHAGSGTQRERAVRLYGAVRDAIPYDLRYLGVDPELYVASRCLTAPGSVCVPKALTLAATARAVGIPARIGFADVRNHLASPRILELMGTDVFHWHAYTVLFIEGRWVKATPAFDGAFCARFGVQPLEFDGYSDSIFQPFDTAGRKHMDYLLDRGIYDDLPFEPFRAGIQSTYPRLLAAMAEERRGLAGAQGSNQQGGETA